MGTYPAGTYGFRITGTTGDTSDFIEFDMVLVDPCPTAALSLKQSPFGPMTHVLRNPE